VAVISELRVFAKQLVCLWLQQQQLVLILACVKMAHRKVTNKFSFFPLSRIYRLCTLIAIKPDIPHWR